MGRIIIMEDDVQQAYDLRRIIEDLGHEVVWVRSATEALVELTALSFDLIITDIYVQSNGRVQRDGGLSLIGAVRMIGPSANFKNYRETPIFAISGATNSPGNENILDIALGMGATIVFKKPIDEKRLTFHLSNVL